MKVITWRTQEERLRELEGRDMSKGWGWGFLSQKTSGGQYLSSCLWLTSAFFGVEVLIFIRGFYFSLMVKEISYFWFSLLGIVRPHDGTWFCHANCLMRRGAPVYTSFFPIPLLRYFPTFGVFQSPLWAANSGSSAHFEIACLETLLGPWNFATSVSNTLVGGRKGKACLT